MLVSWMVTRSLGRGASHSVGKDRKDDDGTAGWVDLETPSPAIRFSSLHGI